MFLFFFFSTDLLVRKRLLDLCHNARDINFQGGRCHDLKDTHIKQLYFTLTLYLNFINNQLYSDQTHNYLDPLEIRSDNENFGESKIQLGIRTLSPTESFAASWRRAAAAMPLRAWTF